MYALLTCLKHVRLIAPLNVVYWETLGTVVDGKVMARAEDFRAEYLQRKDFSVGIK